MSKKYGNPCATYNIPLNNDDDDVFRTGCVHFYNFLHCKSAEYKPLMLKMHLEFVDSPLMTEAEGKNIEEQLEEEIKALKDALQQAKDDGNQLMDRIDKLEKNNSLDYDRINTLLSSTDNAPRQSIQQLEAKLKTLKESLHREDRLKDDVNKLMDCVVKLPNTSLINVVDKATDIVNNTSQDKSNKQAYDVNNVIGVHSSLTGEGAEENIEHNNSNNGVLQSVQQLEARIKTLEDALLQTKSDGNKLTEGVEAIEKIKAVESPDGGNNITQDPKANKQTHNENNLTGEQHNDTENVASASEEHHTCTISEEKQEVLDLRGNCVLIWNPQPYSGGLNNAFSYVRKLANEMNAQIAHNSVIHIDMDGCRNWYVYFRDAESKFEFLKNRFIFKYNPNEGHYLRILDYSNYGIVDIQNFQSSDLCSDIAFVNVLGLAKKMGMKNIRSSIDHIDVYSTGRKCVTYSVRFNCQDKKNEFLQNKYILKEFPETKSLEISDVEGHILSCVNLNNFNMAIASANAIGIAELMGLSLSTADFKRIYVLNPNTFDHINTVNFSLVEFSNNDIKHEFLNEKSELKRIGKNWSSDINISDIKTEGGNIVSIKYCKDPYNVCTAISFIGLAKQLGFSFTSDQIDRLIKLSEFISKASP